MSPDYDRVAAWLREGVRLLVELNGPELGKLGARFWFRLSGHAIEWTLPPLGDSSGRTVARYTTVEQVPPPLVSAEGRKVLRVLREAGQPLQAKNIASRIHVPNNGTLRTLLARLRADGVLDHTSGRGYTLTQTGERVLDARTGEGQADRPTS